MQKVRVPLTNFQYGEVSPSLYSRTDTAVYNTSAQRIENFSLRAEGGLIKRAGLQHIYTYSDITYDGSKPQQSRLMPFVFSDDERYVISIEHQKVRIFQISPIDGTVSHIQTLTVDQNSNPLKFSHDYLDEYTYAQAGDVLFICHQTFAPQQIVRTSLTTFQVETFIFDQKSDGTEIYQPYYNFQKSNVTLDVSASTGTGVTLTTSAPYFDTTGAHNGVTLRYHESEIVITSVTNSTTAVGNILDELVAHLDINSFRTTQGLADIEVTMPKHGHSVGDVIVISHAGTVGGISNNQLNGTRTITEVIDEDRFIFVAGSNAGSSEDGGGSPKIVTHAPTTDWKEQSFSALRGYPAAITFHQNRLCFGGTISQPDAIWMSRANYYYNFNLGDAEDDDSIQITASIGEINQIRHLVSNRDLQIFSASSELYVPAYQNQPITPTNIQIRRQTPFGSDYIRPQSIDGATLFVQKGGAIVREYIYTSTEEAYIAQPVSAISSHLIKRPIEMNTLYGALNRAESYVFLLNSDGTIAVFNSNRGENRAGWTEFTSQGLFHSTISVDDRVFANVVFDTGNGTQRIALCEFNANYNMDMSRVYTGTAGVFDVSAVFADGAVVNVVNGNNHIGEFTVSGGEVDVSAIDPNLTTAEIGYSFQVTLTTNPIDAQLGNGPVTGIPRGIASVFVDLNTTLSCSVNGTNLVIRQVTDDLSQQLAPFTGKKEFRILGYNRDPQITISQSSPLKLQVNGLVAELVF